MERTEMNDTVRAIKAGIDRLLGQEDLQPCAAACLESALAHIDLLYIELGLDLIEN